MVYLLAPSLLLAAVWWLLVAPVDGGSAPGAATALTLSINRLPNATTGVPYSAAITGTGGTPPYTFSLVSGNLPPGLSLLPRGAIAGIPLTSGLFGLTVRMQDSAATPVATTYGVTLAVVNTTFRSAGSVLWSANFETGDLSQQYAVGVGSHVLAAPGGQYNSGVAYSEPSTDYAHTGRWALKMTITPPPESGTRMFRWREPQLYPRLYYSAWYFFPRRYSVAHYWNVFQWKSKRTPLITDPFFVVNVGNRDDETMFFYLYDWQQRRSFVQTEKDIPVGKWVRLDAFYYCVGDSTGRVAIWQDGTLLFELNNVRTRYADGDCQWSVDSYSDAITPSPATFYIDDTAISLDSPVSIN